MLLLLLLPIDFSGVIHLWRCTIDDDDASTDDDDDDAMVMNEYVNKK